jgi:GT2 family glycosyltransferase
MTPLVSVIIPTYNRWPVVAEAVESVLGQSFGSYELIVVDDGSEDGTLDGLRAYGSGVLAVSKPRRGVASARNLGASHSSGRYLAFLDSDDLWRPAKLKVQADYMESHPEVQICQTEEIWLRNGARVNPGKRHRKPSGDIFRASLDLCLVSPSAVMMTRDLLRRVGGFDESLPVCEDYDLWLRIAQDTPVPLIGEPLVIKRGGHADQLSRSTWGMDRFRAQALAKLLRSGIQGQKRIWVLEALKAKVAVLCLGARKRGKEEEALGYECLLAEFFRPDEDHDGRDSELRQDQGVPPADPGAVARAG